jgi:hypothetical protein
MTFEEEAEELIRQIQEAELTSDTPLGKVKEAGEILRLTEEEIREAQRNYLDNQNELNKKSEEKDN